ncbi:hypothetical protein ACQKOH_03675 [Sphingomonas sp. NPDC092331]|jgi:hypothetical protein|uniref:hypothetical protein n=1 Tax=unclassified Sphingomonas TaxID=196159 RepID=UPI0031F4A9D6
MSGPDTQLREWYEDGRKRGARWLQLRWDHWDRTWEPDYHYQPTPPKDVGPVHGLGGLIDLALPLEGQNANIAEEP